MQSYKHIVIVAGEESGDAHAAAFVREIKKIYPLIHLSGIGGQHMQQAGVHLISDLARYGVTGLSGVVRYLRVILRAWKDIKTHLKQNKPDLLILVDYPGFNLRLAQYAKQTLGIRVLYYISPQIWAWKAGRIHNIRETVDHMAVILPFEKKIYEAAGVPVSFVGHPLIHHVKPCQNTDELRIKLGLPIHQRVIAFLPGSRIKEIEFHMPVLLKTASMLYQQYDDLHFVIPIASTIKPTLIQSYFDRTNIPYTLIEGQAVDTAACSDCVVVASGTASLECALLEKPMCIIYKSSVLSYMATFQVIKVKYLGLCNLLQNEMIVPELLQYDCNPSELKRVVIGLLEDKNSIQQMTNRLHRLRLSLSAEQADTTMTAIIEHELNLA
jgi:lipid-A-disaccharide synthase